MKELIINGTVYAKYKIECKMIYLKMIIQINPESAFESENLLIAIIQSVENIKFTSAGYLNV